MQCEGKANPAWAGGTGVTPSPTDSDRSVPAAAMAQGTHHKHKETPLHSPVHRQTTPGGFLSMQTLHAHKPKHNIQGQCSGPNFL